MSLAAVATERTMQQLVRYEALFKLLDDIQALEDIGRMAQPVARQWKYFAGVVNWRLVVADGERYTVIDGSRGQAEVADVGVLSPWDEHHWVHRRPTLWRPDAPADGPPPPPLLCGAGVSEVMVLPFERLGGPVGLLSAAARHRPFSDLDTKFTRIFGRHFADRVFDILFRARATQALVDRATHDALTGLLNRGAVIERLQSLLAVARRSGQPLSVILCDVDFFKAINDTRGHLTGDAVLQELARRLEARARASDSLGRYGGEEFLVVLHPCGAAEALRAAERFRCAVASPAFELPGEAGGALTVTISLGAASTAGGDDIRLEELLRRADEALYAAKASGRNRVHAAEDLAPR